MLGTRPVAALRALLFGRARTSRRRRADAGLTLVELTVVVAIAGVALTATAGAVTSGAMLARTTAETRAASRSSQSLMERIRATPFNDVTTAYSNQSYAMSTIGGGDSTGTCTVTVTLEDTGSSRWRVLKVTVTSNWKGGAGASSHSVVTYVCDRTDGSTLASSRTTVPAN